MESSHRYIVCAKTLSFSYRQNKPIIWLDLVVVGTVLANWARKKSFSLDWLNDNLLDKNLKSQTDYVTETYLTVIYLTK